MGTPGWGLQTHHYFRLVLALHQPADLTEGGPPLRWGPGGCRGSCQLWGQPSRESQSSPLSLLCGLGKVPSSL